MVKKGRCFLWPLIRDLRRLAYNFAVYNKLIFPQNWYESETACIKIRCPFRNLTPLHSYPEVFSDNYSRNGNKIEL
jgi:hypothetical protein